MTNKRLELLDYARFISAIGVVLFHYTYNGIANEKIQSITHIPEVTAFTQYGFLGVQLFFMISGYVIFYSAMNRTPSQFAVSRALRIYPCYFLAVITTAVVSYFWGGDRMSITFSQVIINLAFLHVPMSVPFIDGVYWTLIYEVFFYFVVLVLLLIGVKQHLHNIFLGWPYLMFTLWLFGFRDIPLFSGYFTYFSAGAIYAITRTNKTPQAITAILISIFLTVDTTVDMIVSHPTKSLHLSPIIIFTIIISFHFIFLFQNTKLGQSLRLPGSHIAASLTYPLYLIHAHCGYIALNWLATDDNKYWLYILLIVGVIFASWFLHVLADKKLYRVWNWLFINTLGAAIKKLESIRYNP